MTKMPDDLCATWWRSNQVARRSHGISFFHPRVIACHGLQGLDGNCGQRQRQIWMTFSAQVRPFVISGDLYPCRDKTNCALFAFHMHEACTRNMKHVRLKKDIQGLNVEGMCLYGMSFNHLIMSDIITSKSRL